MSFPLTLSFGLQTISGEVSIVPIHASKTSYTNLEPPTADCRIEQELDIDGSLPQYLSQDVVIVETLLQGAGRTVSRVFWSKEERYGMLVNLAAAMCQCTSQISDI